MLKKNLKIKETRFAKLRLDNDLRQKDIAKELNVLENNYSKWERNVTDIPLLKSNELANFYNCSLDYLFGLSDLNVTTERKNIDFELLSKRLLKMRKEKEITQMKLSDDVGYQQRTYAHYENGSRIPTTFKLMYIAIYYNVSLDYLVGRTDIKQIR